MFNLYGDKPVSSVESRTLLLIVLVIGVMFASCWASSGDGKSRTTEDVSSPTLQAQTGVDQSQHKQVSYTPMIVVFTISGVIVLLVTGHIALFEWQDWKQARILRMASTVREESSASNMIPMQTKNSASMIQSSSQNATTSLEISLPSQSCVKNENHLIQM